MKRKIPMLVATLAIPTLATFAISEQVSAWDGNVEVTAECDGWSVQAIDVYSPETVEITHNPAESGDWSNGDVVPGNTEFRWSDSYDTDLQNPWTAEKPDDCQTTITAKALGDHECDSNEWHFVITGVDPIEPPASITVTWANGSTETVPLDKVTGNIAHYATTSNLDSTVTGASASIDVDWGGQFNLSHGPCEPEEPTLEASFVSFCDTILLVNESDVNLDFILGNQNSVLVTVPAGQSFEVPANYGSDGQTEIIAYYGEIVVMQGVAKPYEGCNPPTEWPAPTAEVICGAEDVIHVPEDTEEVTFVVKGGPGHTIVHATWKFDESILQTWEFTDDGEECPVPFVPEASVTLACVEGTQNYAVATFTHNAPEASSVILMANGIPVLVGDVVATDAVFTWDIVGDDDDGPWAVDSSEVTVVCVPPPPVPPTQVSVPAAPTPNDPCGANNANWVVPANSASVTWVLRSDGHLVASTTSGFVFVNGTTSHDFGIAPDSGVVCPSTQPLPKTGSTTGILVAIGLLSLVAGAVALATSRRPRRSVTA